MLDLAAGISAVFGVATLLFGVAVAALQAFQLIPPSNLQPFWGTTVQIVGFFAGLLAVILVIITLEDPRTAALYYGALVSALAAVVAALQLN